MHLSRIVKFIAKLPKQAFKTMSDAEQKFFEIEKAVNNRAGCKKCKEKCEKGVLRIAKLLPNPWSAGDVMKHWYHVNCLFDVFKTQKAGTKRIECIDDLTGSDALNEEERDDLLEKIQASEGTIVVKGTSSVAKVRVNEAVDTKDNAFQTFCEICGKIGSQSSYLAKSASLKQFLMKGKSGKAFEGDMLLWFKLLLPSANRRIYNLQSKQLVKVFSRVFGCDQQDMLTDLEQGDVSETIRKYFEKSKTTRPNDSSSLTMYEVDQFLDALTKATKEDEQYKAFADLCKRCTADDLKMIIRLIKSDLKINAGPRHVLDGLHPDAYSSFQLSRDLQAVVEKFKPLIATVGSPTKGAAARAKTGGVQVMTPISPMLAEACKSLKTAIAKNPEGVYSEIKYDGERVQIHKQGDEFKFFSRSLKPVMDHKISRCKEFIPKAFPDAQDIILDSEIIVVNTETGELLPFGTLGVHKREKFASSEICLFVFDCIYYNGDDLTMKPLKKRREFLEKCIKPIKNHVQLSEFHLIKSEKDLRAMTAMVLKASLEGLVLKSVNGTYQPGKRGWLKLKKDYLFQGQMADTADLVVLGGWYGTGRNGGMLRIFLMGCYDERLKLWKTVTKVSSGLDDSTLEALHDKLTPLTERSDPDCPPAYVLCKKSLVPDLIAKDPLQMPVWEITGAEFTKSEAHTADGISIRFPRITRIREDKAPKDATSLKELKKLFKASKDNANIDLCMEVDSELDIKTKLFLGTKVGEAKVKREVSPPEMKVKVEVDERIKVEKVDKAEKGVDKIKSEKKNKINELFPVKKIKSENKNENDEYSPPKKIKLEKKEVKEEKINENGVFKGLKVYIKSKIDAHLEQKLKEEGAKVTSDSKEAQIVIHHENYVRSDFDRTPFKRSARHLCHKWVLDSVEKNERQPYPDYAVEIK